MINEHVSEWLGFKVKDYTADDAAKALPPSSSTIYRLKLDWDAEIGFPELFARFLANPGAARAAAIIIGQFHGDDGARTSAEVVQLLVSARSTLISLRGIFLGEMISEENEISWIRHEDVSPLLDAYPALEHLRIRGSDGLVFGTNLRHEGLKSLTIETGGMPRELFNQVMSSEFPALTHLELWLGTDGYGGTVTQEDLQRLLAGDCFPNLNHLGLRDSVIADSVATAAASAPILDRIATLDLSLGTLSDEGGEAILRSDKMRRLARLDLHHHYLSDQMITKLRASFPKINLDERKKEEGYGRYVSVSE